MKAVLKNTQVIDSIETGIRARRERVAAKLTIRQVAEKMGVGVPYLADLERGRRNWNERLVMAYTLAIAAAKK
jgi:transcriptional regulator with XRE-family HTH domain